MVRTEHVREREVEKNLTTALLLEFEREKALAGNRLTDERGFGLGSTGAPDPRE